MMKEAIPTRSDRRAHTAVTTGTPAFTTARQPSPSPDNTGSNGRRRIAPTGVAHASVLVNKGQTPRE